MSQICVYQYLKLSILRLSDLLYFLTSGLASLGYIYQPLHERGRVWKYCTCVVPTSGHGIVPSH